MTLEMQMIVNADGVRRERDGPAGGQQAPVADEGVTAAKEIGAGRGHVDQCLRWVAAVESPGVVPLACFVCGEVVIVTAKQENFDVAVRRGHQRAVNGNYIAGREGRTPGHRCIPSMKSLNQQALNQG